MKNLIQMIQLIQKTILKNKVLQNNKTTFLCKRKARKMNKYIK